MQKLTAIILAAGKGTRQLPLTETVPKQIIRCMGTSTLEENLDNLIGKVREVVIVVGYLKEKIINYIGSSYKGLKIEYVDQGKLKGTAHAVYAVRNVAGVGQVLILNGDDVFEKNIIDKVIKSKGSAVVGKVTKSWQNYGILKAGKNGKFERIVEKPKKFVGDLVNIGCYKVGEGFFDYFKKIKLSERGEYEITDMVTAYAKDHDVKIVKTKSGWYPNSYPWNLLDYTKEKLGKSNDKIEGVVEEGAIVKGTLILGKGSIVRSGAFVDGNFYIGEDCEVGTDCYLKDFGSFDDGVVIKNCTEVTRSILGKETRIGKQSILRDSVIGNKVKIDEKVSIYSSLKNGKNIKIKVKSKVVDTGRKNLGAIVGDNATIAKNLTLQPGKLMASS